MSLLKKIFQRYQPHSRFAQNDKNSDRIITNFFKRFWLEILIWFGVAVGIVFLYPKGKTLQYADLKEGRVYVGAEIIAPFTFPVNKSSEEYAADVKLAEENVPLVFQRNDSIGFSQITFMKSFLSQLEMYLVDSGTTLEQYTALFQDNGIVLAEDDVLFLIAGYSAKDGDKLDVLLSNILGITTDIFSAGVLNISKQGISTPGNKIFVKSSEGEMVEDLTFYRDLMEAGDRCLEYLREKFNENDNIVKIAYQISTTFIIPNVIYDEDETQARKDDAIANVPLVKDQVLAGERIINSHERIEKKHIEKLNSLSAAKVESGQLSDNWLRKVTPFLGKLLLNIFVFSILLVFLWRDRRDIFENRKQNILILLIIVVISLSTFLVSSFELPALLIPVAMGAIIITIFFDTFVGFLVSIILCVLTGILRGNEFSIVLISFIASSGAILTVSRVRTRNWVWKSFAMLSSIYILVIFVNGFINVSPINNILIDSGLGILNAFIAPSLAYIFIIILEFVFDLTTDMTLLELSDMNQPLLRQLAMEAPGTYHHSVLVGTLAEKATEAIGGNALLARVGAYYHDIGKMEKPEYFVENQTKGRNPQENLTPTMSSLILSNHVRKGVEIAKQHNLPKEIEAFIYEHHGTSMMSFFYKKAVEQSSEEQVSENEFRYPGPRPQSRETAIVMLADAVEAASRTLKDPAPSRIRGLIEQLIDERFQSGELDESPLTLQDLSKISDAFQQILNGVFHGRVEYPKSEPENSK